MYILIQDNDGHWYVIPDKEQDTWWDWCELDLADVPDFATHVGGSTVLVKFNDFRIES